MAAIGMTRKTDPLHLDNLRLPPEMVRQHRAVVPKKIQKQQQHFVKVPWPWVERLRDARYIATYRVALYLLYQHWKGSGAPITLSNTATIAQGVTRHRKWEALRELEQLGLITVEKRERRSPRVRIIV
jgi:hypothetical protein